MCVESVFTTRHIIIEAADTDSVTNCLYRTLLHYLPGNVGPRLCAQNMSHNLRGIENQSCCAKKLCHQTGNVLFLFWNRLHCCRRTSLITEVQGKVMFSQVSVRLRGGGGLPHSPVTGPVQSPFLRSYWGGGGYHNQDSGTPPARTGTPLG